MVRNGIDHVDGPGGRSDGPGNRQYHGSESSGPPQSSGTVCQCCALIELIG
jgi:hypothetical protein